MFGMDSRRLLDALVGVYVSLLFVTASALVRWEAIAPEFSVGRAVVIGLAIAAVLALVAGTVQNLAEKVTSAVVLLIWGLPVVYFPYLILIPEPGSTQALVAGAGALAVVPGIGVTSIGTRLKIRRLREASTEIVTITVGEYDRNGSRHWLEVGETVLSVSLLLLLIGLMTLIGPLGIFERPAFGFSLAVGLSLHTLFRHRADDDGSKITVTNMGVTVDQYVDGSLSRSFIRWEDLNGYRLTDDTVELVRPRRFLSTVAFDRGEISDETALVDGIRTYLPRLDEAGKRINEEIESYT